jgi:hypothetical protein
LQDIWLAQLAVLHRYFTCLNGVNAIETWG